jgi:hypothetical protein
MPAENGPPRLTAQEAVDQAAWSVSGPVLLLIVGPAFAVGVVGLVAGAHGGEIAPWVLMALIVGWLFGWLAHSILTPQWRLWAYERVDDLDELKRLGVAARVLWPDGHIIHRTELPSPAVRERLAALEAEHQAALAAAAPPTPKPRPRPRAKSPKASPETPQTP